MMSEAKARELKELYKSKVEDYSKQCREHVDEYGPTPLRLSYTQT